MVGADHKGQSVFFIQYLKLIFLQIIFLKISFVELYIYIYIYFYFYPLLQLAPTIVRTCAMCLLMTCAFISELDLIIKLK